MSREKLESNGKPVGAYCIRPHFEGMAKKEIGITLIALIITIIVMLILVGVSVTVALNGGLFSTAEQAKEGTAIEREEELNLSSGQVEIDGKKYASYQDYLENKEMIELPTGWEVTEKPETWTSEKVTAIKEIATGKIVPLPEGYSVSQEEGEYTIDTGLVITDGTNEFVWIPLAEGASFASTYSGETNYSEPIELTGYYMRAAYDSQTTLNYYYGEGYYDYPETADEKSDVNNTFAYSAHYGEMVTSVNTYGGFYIGRYETTIDGTNIGSKAGATVLTADELLKEGTNTTSNEPYCYRWWGLYAVQRNSNAVGNGTAVQTNMIWGQQWDAMITFFGSKDYTASTLGTLLTSGKQNAGETQYTYNGETISDEICNIYDLRGNTVDWTTEAESTDIRASRGGYYSRRNSTSNRNNMNPNIYNGLHGSRLTLYIK